MFNGFQTSRLVCLLLSSLFAMQLSAKATPTFYALPPLSTGGISKAFGINDGGDVAGAASPASGHSAGVEWIYSSGYTVSPTQLGNGADISRGINYSAEIVGHALVPPTRPNLNVPNPDRAFLYTGGAVSYIGWLFTNRLGDATAINTNGKIVGYCNSMVDGYQEAFIWTPSTANGSSGSMTALPGIGTNDGCTSEAFGINDSDVVVGWSLDNSYNPKATYWSGTTPAALPDLVSGNPSHAYGINASGVIVGDANQQAVLWSGSPYSVSSLSVSGYNSCATAINSNGEAVGYIYSGSGSPYHACIWQSGVCTDLNTLLPANSGWVLQSAQAVNSSGVVVGYGLYNNVTTAFVYVP